jgi:RNA polymerase sigma-70 factor (ECF subfamily)
MWGEVVNSNSQWLYDLSLRIIGRPAEAEDVVQETFLRAFRFRTQLRDFERLRGWLKQICVRLCLRCRRNPQSELSLDQVEAFLPAPASQRPDSSCTAKGELELVLQAMDSLTPRQRTCLVLAVFEGHSGAGIAEMLGLSLGAVKRYIHEARRELERQLVEAGVTERGVS